jgi:hypothetical protein
MLPFSETITLARHVAADSVESWINLAALRDVGDPKTPSPTPSDESGRSPQRFVMDVLVRAGERCWRAIARGQDIYAVSAPIVVQALQRILAGEAEGAFGVRSLGEIVDARDFLQTLMSEKHLHVQYEADAPGVLQRTS